MAALACEICLLFASRTAFVLASVLMFACYGSRARLCCAAEQLYVVFCACVNASQSLWKQRVLWHARECACGGMFFRLCD